VVSCPIILALSFEIIQSFNGLIYFPVQDEVGVRFSVRQQCVQSSILKELQKGFILGMINGFSIGLVGYFGHLDLQFGIVIAFSVCIANVVARQCKIYFTFLLRILEVRQNHLLIDPGMIGMQDCISCLVVMNVVSALSRWAV
jgi:hypothetical protein